MPARYQVRRRSRRPPRSGRLARRRHFYASMLIAGGVSVKVVQKSRPQSRRWRLWTRTGHLWPDREESTRAAVERVLAPMLGRLSGRSTTVTPLG